MGWPGPLLSSQRACWGERGYHRALGTTPLAPPLCLTWLFSQRRGQGQHSHDHISFRAEFQTRSGLAATLACQASVPRPTLYIMLSVPTGLAGGAMSQPVPLCWPDPLQGSCGRPSSQVFRHTPCVPRLAEADAHRSRTKQMHSSHFLRPRHASAIAGQLASLTPSVW